jgi:MFS family permease
MGSGLFLAGRLYDGGRGFEKGALWVMAASFILAGVPLIASTLMHLDRTGDAPTAEVPHSGRIDPAFRRYMIALAVAVLGSWSFLHIHSFFVRLPDTAAASDLGLSWVRFAFWTAGGVAAPLLGIVLDRVGAGRVYAVSLLACGLIPLSFLPTTSVPYAALTMAIYGAAFAGIRNASYAVAAERTPPGARGRHFALYNAVLSLGWGAAAVVVGGPVADVAERISGSVRVGYGASFVAGGAVTLLGLALYLTVGRRRPADAGGDAC